MTFRGRQIGAPVAPKPAPREEVNFEDFFEEPEEQVNLEELDDFELVAQSIEPPAATILVQKPADPNDFFWIQLLRCKGLHCTSIPVKREELQQLLAQIRIALGG